MDLSRRDLFKAIGSAGIAMSTLGFNVKEVKAATSDVAFPVCGILSQ
jgi:hypothetical protein